MDTTVYNITSQKRDDFNKDLYTSVSAFGVTSDVNGQLRNGTLAIFPSLATTTAAVGTAAIGGSVLLSGACGVAVATPGMINSCKKGYQALKAGDAEGVTLNAVEGTSNITYAAMSALMMAQGVTMMLGLVISLTSLLGIIATAVLAGAVGIAVTFAGLTAVAVASSVIGLIMYGCIGARALYGWYGTQSLLQQLEELEKKDDPKEIITWFEKQMSLDDKEVDEIRTKLATTGLEGEELTKRLNEESANRLQKKWNAFGFKTSSGFEQKVRTALPKLIEEYKSADMTDVTKKEAVDKEVRKLLADVKEAAYKTKVRYKLLVLISVIGTLSFAIALALAGPLAPIISPLVFVLANTLWLSVDYGKLHNKVADYAWNRHLGGKKKTA